MFKHGLFYGSKKAWATPKSVSFRGLIQNFRRAFPPLCYASLPLGGYITLKRTTPSLPLIPHHPSPSFFSLSLSPCRPLSLPSPPPCSHHLNVRVAVVIHLLFSLELLHLLLLLLLLLLFLLQFNPSCFSLVLLLRSSTFFFLFLMLLLR